MGTTTKRIMTLSPSKRLKKDSTRQSPIHLRLSIHLLKKLVDNLLIITKFCKRPKLLHQFKRPGKLSKLLTNN